MDDASNITAPTKIVDTGEVKAKNAGRTSRTLVTLAACSLILLFAGMERTMADPILTPQVVQVEHIKIETTKKFADVVAALEKNVPQLDPAIAEALEHGDEQKATELERGQPLFIFLKRDHGALLQVVGLPRKALQYEIGNPHTASKMTRHRLPAGLYAPLRVFLYEDERGRTIFEYDKPSSQFGQFGDEHVSAVGRGLDEALERALRQAAE
jgi:hypothetical protein